MEIRSLSHTSLDNIIEALQSAFSDYFVPISGDLSYWENRLRIARIDYSLSFGMFDQEKLVGFILNGIDPSDGKLTAFNTGTGVIPEYRNRQIIDQLYAAAQPAFIRHGISQYALEVIEENKKAMRVYERIGFRTSRHFRCFKGQIRPTGAAVETRAVSFPGHHPDMDADEAWQSWDHMQPAIALAGALYTCFEVVSGGRAIGYFMINLQNGYIARLNLYSNPQANDWQLLLNGIAQIAETVKLNNVDSRRTDLTAYLLQAGLENYINQYEMKMDLIS
jgi:ribosomal protein S18 acetylase RimI-like enzyme